MSLAAGSLNRRVTIERATLMPDQHGDEAMVFTELASAWASIRPSPGRERLANAQNAAEALTIFTIRWRRLLADLNPKDRIEYPIGSARYWNIVSVVEYGRREGLEIAATASAD